jgi:Mg/Co/Ni transporter MgtE
MTNTPDYEFIRQIHEFWLSQLEALAVQAIISNNWNALYSHVVDFQNEYDLHGATGIANVLAQNPTVRKRDQMESQHRKF